jgi:hypothetical protein
LALLRLATCPIPLAGLVAPLLLLVSGLMTCRAARPLPAAGCWSSPRRPAPRRSRCQPSV